jgi:Protein of unknown function (DUF3570)
MTLSNSKTLLLVSMTCVCLTVVESQAKAHKAQFNYQYSIYTEDALPTNRLFSGNNDAVEVTTHLLDLHAPLNETTEGQLILTQETRLGPIPLYVQPNGTENLQVMSDVSLEENRTDITLNFNKKTEKSESTLSLGYASEDYFQSFSGGVSTKYLLSSWLYLNLGVNYSEDFIDTLDHEIFTDRPLEESKKRLGAFLGFSYAAGQNTLIGFTSSYAIVDGYLSDPYRSVWVANVVVPDSRPDSVQQVTNTLQIRQFIPSLNAALHLDYRYFISDWLFENSNTFNLAWHQNFGSGWMLIPSIRLYDQPAAYFYSPYYNASRNDGYNSSDYRLSAFDAASAQIKLTKKFTSFAVSISHETYEAKGNHPGLVNYNFSNISLAKTF